MSTSKISLDLAPIAHHLEQKGPAAALDWAIATFGRNLAVATGFGPQGIVILHLVSQIAPCVKVFYLETDLFFDETYALRDQLQTRLGLTIQAVHSDLSLEQQAATYGENLWRRDPDLCCYLRKVAPLRRYLSDKRAWVTGIRRDQTITRTTASVLEWDDANGLVKVNPLVAWSEKRVWEYIREHDLPFNPLHRQGYPSIGCWPCTRAVQPGEDLRAGRWSGFAKTECGLHLNGNNGKTARRQVKPLQEFTGKGGRA